MSDERPRSEPLPTSAMAPDMVRLRDWMTAKIKALAFDDLVTMIIVLIVRMRDLNTELQRKLLQYRRARPRSETLKRVEAQLSLGLPEPQQPTKKPQAENAETPKRERKHGGGRKKKPKEWPRQVVLNPVPEELRKCPTCGREMKTVGYQKCEKLELKPAEVFVEERRDERVACPHDNTIVSAPTPAEIVERGALGTVFITEAACDKFLEQMPIERQARRWLRARVHISPRTLGRAVCGLADLCKPVARAIHEETQRCELLATDATSFPILDPSHPENIRTGAVWVWIGNVRWVSFLYAPDAGEEHPKKFFGEARGRIVQCDGTFTLNFIEKNGGKRPACWAHARRRFVAAARAGDKLALEALHTIARLFAIDAESCRLGEDAVARQLRRANEAPAILEELREWRDRYRGLIPPKTPLGEALGYLYRQWPRLLLFLEDGRIELTNNHCERELRRLVLGRRNWLFAMKDIGGERAATMLTIIGTCIAHGISPRQYLHELVKRLLGGWKQADIRELLPDKLGATMRLQLPSSVGSQTASLPS